MAAAPKWVPAPGGTLLRGLEVKNGMIEWAMLRTGDPRKKSIFLNESKVPLHSTNTSIVTAEYGPGGRAGAYPVIVTPHAAGSAKLLAGDLDPAKAAVLEVKVCQPQTASVAFHNVKAPTWTTTAGGATVLKLLDVANALYMYQGNIKFVQIGAIDTVEISAISGDTVDRHGAGGFKTWGNHLNTNAILNVFFVKDYNNSATASEEWAGVHKNWMVFEPTISNNMIGMVFSHEAGHFLGLSHPLPVIALNLMNQSSVGDRKRYKSYLTRQQIETVTDKCNWGGQDYQVCSVIRTVEPELKKVFDWLSGWLK